MAFAAGRLTLAMARDAVPDVCSRRSWWRGVMPIVGDGLVYLAALVGLVVAPLWATPALIVVAGFAVAGLFVLGHDAAHGALFGSRVANRWTARVLMLPSLHVQEAWVLGHNRVHHGFTAREGMDFVWHPTTPDAYRALSPLARLLHRVEWSAFGSGLYYVREVWWNRMVTFRPPPKHARAIWADWVFTFGCAALVSVGAATLGWARGDGVLGAVAMWAKLVVGPFVAFAYLIGWTVYVHHVGPAIRWWSAEAWTPWRAQMESTTVLRAPGWLNLVFHNIFLHVPHHVDPSIPWYRLPAAAAALEAAFPGAIVDKPLRLRDWVRATRTCKLYDFNGGAWLPYSAAS